MKIFSLVHIFDNLKIRYKLFLAYFLVTIVPVTCIGYFSYNASLKYVKEKSTVILSQLQQNTVDSINKRLERYVFLADTIYYNKSILNVVSSNYDDNDEYDIIVSNLDPMILTLLNATGSGIYLALIRYDNIKNESIMYNFDNIMQDQRTNYNYIADGQQFYNIFNYERVENRQWFKELFGKMEDYQWVQIDSDKRFKNISLMREMSNYNIGHNPGVGMLRLTISLADVLLKEKNYETQEKDFNLIFDKNGDILSVEPEKEIFYSKHKEIINKCLSLENNKNLTDMENIFIKSDVNSFGWKIITVFPTYTLTENAKDIRNTTIIYCVIALIILFIMTYLISTSFSKRIINISQNMESFKSGNFNTKIMENKNDELGFLAIGFNDMTERIKTLIRDNYQANIDKKDAQLRALQSQINPHFLYNSMSAIDRLADSGENKEIKSMVRALTSFYRMTLNKGRDIISISDEIEQVKAYIDVNRIRKGEYFNVYYNIDNTALGFYTVKVILQPFVENIFEHGIGPTRKAVNIIISAILDEDSIIFEIIDDGIGIKREKMNLFYTEKIESLSSGYGIKNVNERIKMYFGDEYGIKIFSIWGAGTTVSVKIPKYLLGK